ncbi:hypothetical protein OSB04_021082 [Centaurea solstitialis]|uniref:TsaA-like domain-containing protein n=1 Tax=Centaurea solstitialis TaxID=347529 RepID=A0AA38WFX0_9ASTR|nr:hypothetical protein OSB04_021082 [Centaurea solstitialis]
MDLRKAMLQPKTDNLETSYPMAPIATIRSCFSTRNGTPRQPLIVPLARARLMFDTARVPPASLEGLEEYSHCWIIYVFHLNTDLEKLWKDPSRSKLKAKVRVPRMKGEMMGLFATRSPHRPSPIGLTVAKVESVEGTSVLLSGVDLVDGTPVLDIKPYLPYCDSIKGALVPGWVKVDDLLAVASVDFSEDFFASLSSIWPAMLCIFHYFSFSIFHFSKYCNGGGGDGGGGLGGLDGGAGGLGGLGGLGGNSGGLGGGGGGLGGDGGDGGGLGGLGGGLEGLGGGGGGLGGDGGGLGGLGGGGGGLGGLDGGGGGLGGDDGGLDGGGGGFGGDGGGLGGLGSDGDGGGGGDDGGKDGGSDGGAVDKKSLYTSVEEFQRLIKEVLLWDIRSVSQRSQDEQGPSQAIGQALFLRPYVDDFSSQWVLSSVILLTLGSVLTTYIGDRITDLKLGNGTSLLIFTSIVSYLPASFGRTVAEAFQVNSSGVMPIIFSTSSLALPGTLARFTGLNEMLLVICDVLGAFYLPTNILLIGFFNYYYTFLQLDPDDVSEQLKRQGASIPFVRPGKSTAAFFFFWDKVLSRISVLGSVFLAVLAAGPAVVEQTTHLTAFRGFAGTSVLILVGCATDTARKVQVEIISQKYKNIEFYEIDKDMTL